MARNKKRSTTEPTVVSSLPEHEQAPADLATEKKLWQALVALGVVLAILFGIITHLTAKFELTLPLLDRPILLVVGLFMAAFFLYIAAIVVAKRIPDSFQLSATIIGFAVLFRLIMFFSTPIQEIDIYRYIWDGVVVAEGVSPFRYPPDQIRNTPLEFAESDKVLSKLVARYQRGRGAADALNLVHYGQVPTVYPPVSQAVFGAAAFTTPLDASLLVRLRIMKGWLILFDIGTVLLLVSLLKSLRMPVGLSIAYAWCPLVLKEIGNSGHLDSIAIFLTTLAVWAFVRNIMLRTSSQEPVPDDELQASKENLETDSALQIPRRVSWIGNLLPVLFLALAIGAKVYAVVLAPLFLFVAIRRLGFTATIVPAIAFVAATIILALPMLPKDSGLVCETAQIHGDVNPGPGDGVVFQIEVENKSDVQIWDVLYKLVIGEEEVEEAKPMGDLLSELFSDRPPPPPLPENHLPKFIPDGLVPTTNYATVSQGVYTPMTGIWEIGSLDPGAKVTLKLEGMVLNLPENQKTVDLTDAHKQFQATQTSDTGLGIFFKYWEMNDFVFMNTVENLKPRSLENRKDPWFTFYSEPRREKLSDFVEQGFGVQPAIAPFMTARFLLTSIFIIIALSIAVWAARRNDPAAVCRAGFLTLAWFWLLAPTQNPWYWLWALPLIPFAKNRTWYLMSGILFIYYIRFWIEYHCSGVSVTRTLSIRVPEWASKISHYQGVDFFDFVVTWFEYLPWYLLLIIETTVGLWGKRSSDQ